MSSYLKWHEGKVSISTNTNDKGEQNLATAIIYYSKHHGNTKQLLDAIAAVDSEVDGA